MRFLIPSLCALNALAAQAPVPPADSALRGITARGRLLVQYDIAAWHGTDAVMALKPTEPELNTSVARRTGNGLWEVLFGRLTQAKDTFFVHYRAVQTTSDSAFLGTRLPRPLATTGVERDMSAAIVTALADFGRQSRPYNAYALPAEPAGIWVYLLPAQTSTQIFPHGGDMRYHLVANGTRIAGKHRFHQAILDNPMPKPGVVAGYHTSFESQPSETDVFLVLRRFPHLRELIATEHFHYEIQTDGTIIWRPAKP